MSRAPRIEARNASRVLALALAGGAAVAVGCGSTRHDPASVAPARPLADLAASGAAPVPVGKPNEVPNRATRIVWSGLSKVTRGGSGPAAAAGSATIDVRVDSLDANGDFATASGEFRVTVRAEGCEPESQAFDLPVSCVDEQRRHLDALLGQYVLRIEPRWSRAPVDGARLSVTVSVTTVLGTVLSTEGAMRW